MKSLQFVDSGQGNSTLVTGHEISVTMINLPDNSLTYNHKAISGGD